MSSDIIWNVSQSLISLPVDTSVFFMRDQRHAQLLNLREWRSYQQNQELDNIERRQLLLQSAITVKCTALMTLTTASYISWSFILGQTKTPFKATVASAVLAATLITTHDAAIVGQNMSKQSQDQLIAHIAGNTFLERICNLATMSFEQNAALSLFNGTIVEKCIPSQIVI